MNEWTNEMSDKAIYAVMERCGMLQNESGLVHPFNPRRRGWPCLHLGPTGDAMIITVELTYSADSIRST